MWDAIEDMVEVCALSNSELNDLIREQVAMEDYKDGEAVDSCNAKGSPRGSDSKSIT